MWVRDLNLAFTNNCNFACVMCPHGYHLGSYDGGSHRDSSFHTLKKGFVDEQTISRLLESLALSGTNVENLTIQWVGESLMHPEFVDIFERILSINSKFRFISNFVLNTNAVFLTEDTSRRLIESVKFYRQSFAITFSVDAVSQEAFSSIKRTKYPLSKVVANVKSFIALKKAISPGNLVCIVQSLVLRENFDELNEFCKSWREYFDKLGMGHRLIFDMGSINEKNMNYIFIRKTDYASVKGEMEALFQEAKESILRGTK